MSIGLAQSEKKGIKTIPFFPSEKLLSCTKIKLADIDLKKFM